ncbi:DUF2961 domain-containing protein [Aureibaculum luteum]|uniref:DUF2961 domain-containing protein n=1 Tax=Aureibaculum luteum TaxID=1548456 RepID=UPI000E4906B9|nr:DUF2961 domain-containing protein [Aureibaculum luteum]
MTLKLRLKIVTSLILIIGAVSCTQKVKVVKNDTTHSMDSLKTFGTMGKELKVLKKGSETELFSYQGKGCITHMWFGGQELKHIDIKIYVDGEVQPSIDMEMYLGHGIGFKDDFSPWGTERMGNIGGESGIYNTYKVPFGTNIRITAQLTAEGKELENFWWIFRGTENLPVEFNGVKLPDNARLKLHKLEKHKAQPLEEFSMCDIDGSGMLYQVTMEAKGLRKTNHWKDLSFMESCIRAYIGGKKEPLFLSSGLEDYFLGTYYFNKGRYTNMLAGLTHFDKEENEFSGYRLHENDPVFFQNGMRLTNRCGEEIDGKIFHDPPATEYTTYVWTYEW